MAAAGGILCAVVIAELGVRVCFDEEKIVSYTIQRNSPYFSAELDDRSPLYYTYHGIKTDGSTHVSVQFPNGKAQRFSFTQPENIFRVIAVGDSITELWSIPGYVNYTDFLTSMLKENLPNKDIEVIPLGVGGYNTWQEMHFYKKELHQMRTDVLILQYCSNDADVMTLRKRPSRQITPDNEWPEYEIVGTRIGKPDLSRFEVGPFQSKLRQLLTHRITDSHNLHGYTQIEGNTEQRTALLWFRDMARQKGVPLFVVVFPLFDDEYSQAESTYIKSLLNELDIEYLDLLPKLKKQGLLTSMARDVYHPNNSGHEYSAQAILDYLSEKGLLP